MFSKSLTLCDTRDLGDMLLIYCEYNRDSQEGAERIRDWSGQELQI